MASYLTVLWRVKLLAIPSYTKLSGLLLPPSSAPAPTLWASPRPGSQTPVISPAIPVLREVIYPRFQWLHHRGWITTCNVQLWLLPQALVQTLIWFLRFQYPSSSPRCVPLCHHNSASLLMESPQPGMFFLLLFANLNPSTPLSLVQIQTSS